MKNWIVSLISCVVIVSGCDLEPQTKTELGQDTILNKMLEGEHQLIKMINHNGSHSRAAGAFFLIAGGFISKGKSGIKVTFSWRMDDGTYAISSLPIEKIRMQLVESISTPTIRFHWKNPFIHYAEEPEPQEVMDSYVKRAVITCKPEDWPTNVQLPLND